MDPEYRKHYKELYERHWWWRAREEIIVNELRRQLAGRSNLAILDVGCGDGLFFHRLREFGNVEGVEPSADLVDPLGPHRHQIIISPFDERFHPGKQYDVILLLDVLEHLTAPLDALRHAVSLLTPEGILLITVPSFEIIWTSHDDLNGHLIRYTKKSLRALAADAGIRVVRTRYFFAWLFAVKLATRMMESVFQSKPQVPKISRPGVNRLLEKISLAEEKLTRFIRLPFGSSLLTIGGRKTF